MLAITRLANSSAARPAAPLVRGSLRERAASMNAWSSACNGSTAGAFSFSNPNSGCGPGVFTPMRQGIAPRITNEIYSCCWKKRILRTRSVETRLAVMVGYGSSCKFQARMGDVHFFRQNRNTTAFTSTTVH